MKTSPGRPKTPLIQRVAKLCGERHLDKAYCWQWGGALSKTTPVINHNGKVRPVRRALYDELIEKLDPWQNVTRDCTSQLCVNPWMNSPPALV